MKHVLALLAALLVAGPALAAVTVTGGASSQTRTFTVTWGPGDTSDSPAIRNACAAWRGSFSGTSAGASVYAIAEPGAVAATGTLLAAFSTTDASVTTFETSFPYIKVDVTDDPAAGKASLFLYCAQEAGGAGGTVTDTGLAWHTWAMGGGGYVTDMDIAPNGTMVARTDTVGAYKYVSGSWQQLFNENTINKAYVVPAEINLGTYEIAVAPSLPSRLYAAYRGDVYRKDGEGEWTNTNFVQLCITDPPCLDGNDSGGGYSRLMGEKMAVDPVNPDHVIFGTQFDGAWVTVDGGTTWSQIPLGTIPAALEVNLFGGTTRNRWISVAFDSSDGTVGSPAKTRNIYLASSGNGVYFSSDGGSTWSQIADGVQHATVGGPTMAMHARVLGGIYYATEATVPYPATQYNVWTYNPDTTTWTSIVPASDSGDDYFVDVLPDPHTAGRIVLVTECGRIRVSTNGGASFAATAEMAFTDPTTPYQQDAMPAGSCVSTGGGAFDPLVPGKLWMSWGMGMMYTTDLPPGAQVDWVGHSDGIENLVANPILALPGSARVIQPVWDRGIISKAYADANANAVELWPDATDLPGRFTAGWAVDYASTDPTVVVGTSCWFGTAATPAGAPHISVSTDSGATFNDTAAVPAGSTDCFNTWGMGGTIAASTPSNWIVVPSLKRRPYYTTDAGATWNPIGLLPGVPNTGAGYSGVHWQYYLNRHTLAADRVTSGTFYLYYSANETANDTCVALVCTDPDPGVLDDGGACAVDADCQPASGIFRTIDGGATWTRRSTGEPNSEPGFVNLFNAQLRSVPGHAGHLWFTAGGVDGTLPTGAFARSTNGGTSWSIPSANVKEAQAFDFGPVVNGYPSLFFFGYHNSQFGLFESLNQGESYRWLSSTPGGILLNVNGLAVDDTTGRIYVSTHGGGAVWAE